MKLKLWLFLFCAIASGADIINTSRNTTLVLNQDAVWGSSGPTGTDNIYVFIPQATTACILILNNNPTSAHAFTYTVYATVDPAAGSPSSQDSWKWENSIFSGGPNALAQRTFYFPLTTSGKAKVAFGISASSTQAGTPDTASIFAVNTNGTSCASVSFGTTPTISGQLPVQFPQLVGGIGTGTYTLGAIRALPVCDLVANASSLANGSTILQTSPTNNRGINICAATVSVGVSSTGAFIQLLSGTGALCGTGSSTRWIWQIPTNSSQTTGNGLGAFTFSLAGNDLCVNISAETGSTAAISISYSMN